VHASDRERRNVVGGDSLEDVEGVWTPKLKLAHVADVEETDSAPDRSMLFENACILHRHLPPAERDESSAEPDVRLKEWRSLERGVRNGHNIPRFIKR
jgi:hypothetical protein